MPDLDFSELRGYVEMNTYLPEFHEVQRRARRIKRRRRLATGVAMAGALGLIAPVAVASGEVIAHTYPAPGGSLIGISGGNTVVRIDTPKPAPPVVTRNLVAADGVDLEHVFGLVDVCADAHCSLQVTEVDPGGVNGTTQRVGLFRTKSTDTVSDPRIVAIDDHTVTVSATVGSGSRQSETLTLTPINTQSIGTTTTPVTRPIQPVEQGDIRMVGDTGTVLALPHQPPVTSPSLACRVSGWWVSGIDPATGELAVSVSQDEGRTWSTHPVGALPGNLAAAIATVNGIDVYLLVSSGGQVQLRKSDDRGATWVPTATHQAWPADATYGMVARADGSLLVWITQGRITSYLRSTNRGASFVPDEGPPGPGGPIVVLRDGFLALGTSPALSHDGVTWSAAYVPWVNITG